MERLRKPQSFKDYGLIASKLPIVWEPAKFDEFCENFDATFPASAFPDFEIRWQILLDGKVRVLGFGTTDEVIKQISKHLKQVPEIPGIREIPWRLKTLRRTGRIFFRRSSTFAKV